MNWRCTCGTSNHASRWTCSTCGLTRGTVVTEARSGDREYQQDLVRAVIAAFNGGDRTAVLQMGTGAGKTHTAADIIRYAVGRGHRVVFMAHLDQLVSDTHARLTSAGIRAGFVQAGRPVDAEAMVQVASLQTLHARGAMPVAKLVILDECHRAMGPTVRAILDAYPNAWILGLTATPQRGDGKPLGAIFGRLISGPSNRWLTDNGFLVPIDVIAPACFNDDALVEEPVAAYHRVAPGKRAIVFAASVAHARQLAVAFTKAGYVAGLILGTTPREDRERLRADCVAGTIPILIGVGVFIEGFDLPAIEVVILARPFSVTGAFLQAIGRGSRPSPSTGKTRCIVLDLRGSVHEHGLPDEDRTWSLTGNACVRTETMTTLRRCNDCFAIYRPSRVCPRCRAEHVVQEKIPRVLRRAEKLERMNDVPPHVRDERYVWKLVNVAKTRMRMNDERAMQWALKTFEKQKGRKPEKAA